jgi:hypothetical protein
MMQWTLRDLVFLKENDVAIDAGMLEFVRAYENMNRNIGTCEGCCAITFEQHQPSCPCASILFEPRWFEILLAREAS